MYALRPLCLVLALALSACSSTSERTFNFQTAAAGTQTEAAQVVALVVGQATGERMAALEQQLLYSGAVLDQAVRRLHQRFPRVRGLLERGLVGNSESGFIVLREVSAADELLDGVAVGEWVRQENHDRAVLYTQASVAVGHGTDNLRSWLPYASFAFGAQWIKQGQPGWWVFHEDGRWEQYAPERKTDQGG